jgi:DNA repair photolyase
MVDFRQAVSIITKNRLVCRDIDLLGELARYGSAGVFVSVTTLDAELARVLEPRTSPPLARLSAIRNLSNAGIPAGVLVGPVIPGLTEHELPSILDAAANAGAQSASYIILRLPHAVAELFEDWLDRHRPAAKEKVLGRIRSVRSGRLNDPRFGSRMRGEGPIADLIRQMFYSGCRQAGLNQRPWPVSAAAFRRPEASGQAQQLRLFE